MELFDWQGSEVVSGSESSLKLMSTNIPALPVSLSPSLRLSDSFPSHQGSFRFHLYIYYYHMTQKSIFRVYSNGIESPLVRYLCFHIHQVSFELFWQLLSLRCLSKEFKTSPEGPWLLLPTKLFAFHFFQGYPLLSELCTAVQRNLVNEGRWAVSRLCQGQLRFLNSPCSILWGEKAVPLVLKASTCRMALQQTVKQIEEGRRPFWTLTDHFGSSYTYAFLRPLIFFPNI